MSNRDYGLNPRRFLLTNPDGSDPGPGFVLLYSDPFAPAALEAYANICRDEYPHLAKDLDTLVARLREQV